MSFTSQRTPEPAIHIESLQEFYTVILEYYDELIPLKETCLDFFLMLQREFQDTCPVQPAPLCRFLGIGSATGNLENKLSAHGLDITGIDKNPDMIETAKRRMKRGSSTLRFFEMSALDMKRFLKKGSFNIISCINNVIPYISDETLLRKFFHDARELLAPSGKFVIQTINFDYLEKHKLKRLPDLKSIRVTLERDFIPGEDGLLTLDATLELGSGRKILLQKNTRLVPTTVERLETYAKEAGFTGIARYGDFDLGPWTDESPSTIMVLY